MYQLVFADRQGQVFEHPRLLMLGRTGGSLVEPAADEMIPLPPGASLILLPGRIPVGISPGKRRLRSGGVGSRRRLDSISGTPVETNPYRRQDGPVSAVAALLPQGYTRTLVPGYACRQTDPLPLYGYAAVGWREGRFFVAAVQTDEDHHWNPRHYNSAELDDLVRKRLTAAPGNRILKQLGTCALEYGCYTAQNIFFRRWEGGVPVSPKCNARCVGCISLQSSQCCPAPQSRIRFTPTVTEIAEVAISHLDEAEEGIVSFGQGCEGEPALAGDLLARAIRLIRSATARGTINMNSNAGFTEGVARIVAAGLDSIRVSLNSPDPAKYCAYYRPGYSLDGVSASLRLAARAGTYTSLNLLVFPGVTDTAEEADRLVEFVRQNEVKMIQLRNLNIDPDIYTGLFPAASETLGIPGLIRYLQEQLPGVRIGNYSRPTASS